MIEWIEIVELHRLLIKKYLKFGILEDLNSGTELETGTGKINNRNWN